MPGTGGLLKARWSSEGSGKQGGLRVIYYHMQRFDVYLLLLLYPKSKKDDLTTHQKRILRQLVETEIKHWERSHG